MVPTSCRMCAEPSRTELTTGGGLTVRTPIPGELSLCLNAGAMGRIDAESETLIPERTGGGFDVAAIFDERQITSPDNRQSCDPSRAVPTMHEKPFTLAIRGRGDSHQLETRQDGTANAILTPNGGRGGIGVGAVAFANTAGDTNLGMSKPGVPPLTRRNGDPGNVFVPGMQVRRLTPRECERLQGFPDDYTLVPYRGKPAADGPRYKALGNSMAVPVMRWIGERISEVTRQGGGST